jgi:hypothetical protein
MAAALADLPVSPLVNIYLKPPQISALPLSPSEHHPPGATRTSKIQTGACGWPLLFIYPRFIWGPGVDAERMYNATVGQRAHILEQLEEAESNGRDALFALEIAEMELAHKTATMKSALSRLSETLPPLEFEEMCYFVFGQSKEEWERVWKREWVEDDTERNKFTQARGPSKTKSRSNSPPNPPAHHPRSSSLPPSSPLPNTSPNLQDHLPPRPGPVPMNGIPVDGFQLPPRPRTPPSLDGFKAPRGFVDHFGSTRYQPIAPEPVAGPSRPQQSRRLKRDLRRLEEDRNGNLILVDTTKEIEEQRRQIKESILLQAQRRVPVEVQESLKKIVRSGNRQDPPVTWSRVFGDENAHANDLTNSFAQDDHVRPSVYPEPDPHREPDGGDEVENESESEANPHVQDDHP